MELANRVNGDLLSDVWISSSPEVVTIYIGHSPRRVRCLDFRRARNGGMDLYDSVHAELNCLLDDSSAWLEYKKVRGTKHEAV